MVMMEAMCRCAVPNTGSGGAIELSERVREFTIELILHRATDILPRMAAQPHNQELQAATR